MSNLLPGPASLSNCKRPSIAKSSTVNGVELSRTGNPPLRYLVSADSPRLFEYQHGFFNEASIGQMEGRDLLLRMQIPIEVKAPLEELGVGLKQKTTIELCSYLYRSINDPGTDAQRWISGYVDSTGPTIYINFFDHPMIARSSFSLLTNIAYYAAKASILVGLKGRYPEKADNLARLFAKSVEHRLAKILIGEECFDSFNYTHWDEVNWESEEGGSFFRYIHRSFQALEKTLKSQEAQTVFNIQGSLPKLSASNPILVQLR